MAKSKKQTKKFLSKVGLDKALEQRKKVKAIANRKGKARQNDKKPAAHKKEHHNNKNPLEARPIEDMSVDEFMAKGFMDSDDCTDSDVQLDALDVEESNEDGEISHEEIRSKEGKKEKKIVQKHENKKSEISEHKESLTKLKEEQPEFFKYLQENDEGLLSFLDEASDEEGDTDEDVNLEEGPQSDDEDEVEVEATLKPKSKTKASDVLTVDKVNTWVKGMKNNEIGAMKKMIRVFYDVCGRKKDSDTESKYTLASGATYNALVKNSLWYIPKVLDHHLKVENPKADRGAPLPTTAKGWKKLRAPIKILLQSILELFSELADGDAKCFALRQCLQLCPYYASFPKINRVLFKKMLHIWSRESEAARVAAFLVIRKQAIVSPYPFIDVCLKGVYLTFIRNCKFPTPSVRPILTFMLNSVVEIYSLDMNSTYQHAFVYIRQLAIHLRNAMVLKKKDHLKHVYNWQFVYALKVWTKVISGVLKLDKTNDQELRPLIYPLVQVIMGVIKLIPTSSYFPIRFQCIRMLLDVIQTTGVYIPLSSQIFDTLNVAEMNKRPKPVTGKPLDLQTIIKVNKKDLITPQFQDAVTQEVFELGLRYNTYLAYSIAYPEMTFVDAIRLKSFFKKCKNKHITSKLSPLLNKIQENTKFIITARQNVVFSPCDSEKVQQWENALMEKKASPMDRFYRVWEMADANKRKLMTSAVQKVEGKDFNIENRKDNAKRKANSEIDVKEKKQKTTQDEGDVNDDDEDDSDSDASSINQEDDGMDMLEDFKMSDFELDSDED
eukprot:m.128942 g.128942  ORF g.128942 m.128942 type:complete len:780 (-) comp14568_c0_seq6:1072-3411(-)